MGRDRGGIVAWDLRVARASVLATMIGFAIALLLTAATDEGGIGWNERLSRTLPAVPACAGVGAFLALEARRLRGELRALATLGRSPARAAFAAALGAAIAGAALSVIVATRAAFDASAFFPVVRTTSSIRFEAGAFVEDASGLRVAPDGSMRIDPNHGELGDPRGRGPDVGGPRRTRARAERIAAGAAAVLASLAFALMGAQGVPRRRDLLALAAFAAFAIGVFHAIAVDRLPMFASAIPTIALIAFASLRYGGKDAWSKKV